ncbi:MAG: Trk system potassium transporter TrkA [Planctomycetes bacterium]|nr:Trk system potassium transporter TrkA [Planctomycetota bacterium]
MKILIVGAGAVGLNLARQLSNEAHDISIVEQDPALVRKVSDKLDALIVSGNATSKSTLEEAGIQDVEMVLAVTDSDETNIIVCLLAHMYGVKTKIARVRNEEFAVIKSSQNDDLFHVDYMVNPEQITVDSIINIIETPGAIFVADFTVGDILLRGFHVPADAPIVGKKIRELKEIESVDSFLIVAIQKNDAMIIPVGDSQIQPDDNIFVLVARAGLPFFLPMVNRRADEAEKIIIYGATRTGVKLAKRLEHGPVSATIIEPDEEKANAAAVELSETVILHGEATDVGLLKEASIEDVDFFIALTEDEQSNILSALVAKKNGAKKTIVLTNDPQFVPVLSSIDIDIDIVINPRLITAGSILQHIRRGRILSIAKLPGSEAEAIELVAEAGSKIIGKNLSKVHFPEGSIMGAIVRNGTMLIPNGESVVNPGESVVVFTLPKALEKVQSLFSVK